MAKAKRKKAPVKAKGGGATATKKVRSSPPCGFPSSELTGLVDAISESSGEGAAQRLGSDALALKIRGTTSTQCETLDAAIGRGGVPWGRLSIVHGAEGSGKTTVAGHLVAECQRQGGVALYQDKEYKLDPDYFAALGVNIDDLIISQPNHLEASLAVIDTTIRWANGFRERQGVRVPVMIVLDSMNATLSKEMFEKGWDEQSMASVARVYSQKLPKIMQLVSAADVALVFISQVREKVGIMFGDKEQIAGGRSPRFHASLIFKVGRKGTVKDEDDEKAGNVTEVYVGKNQIARPFRKAEFLIRYGTGIDYEDSLVRQGIAVGEVEKKGAWYSVPKGPRLGQGIEKAAAKLRAEPKLAVMLRDRVRAHLVGV